MDKLNPPAAHQLPEDQSSTQSRSLTPSSPDADQAERLRKINRMVGRLFTAYPKTDYDDPKAALAAMVHVLSAYPLKLVDRLTNLQTGMQLRYKFPPRLAEIKTEADALMSDKAAQLARNERVAAQIAAREEAEMPKGDRPSIVDLKAKYGENYGLDPHGADRKVVENTFKAPSVEELRAYYAANPDRITKLTGPAGTR